MYSIIMKYLTPSQAFFSLIIFSFFSLTNEPKPLTIVIPPKDFQIGGKDLIEQYPELLTRRYVLNKKLDLNLLGEGTNVIFVSTENGNHFGWAISNGRHTNDHHNGSLNTVYPLDPTFENPLFKKNGKYPWPLDKNGQYIKGEILVRSNGPHGELASNVLSHLNLSRSDEVFLSGHINIVDSKNIAIGYISGQNNRLKKGQRPFRDERAMPAKFRKNFHSAIKKAFTGKNLKKVLKKAPTSYNEITENKSIRYFPKIPNRVDVIRSPSVLLEKLTPKNIPVSDIESFVTSSPISKLKFFFENTQSLKEIAHFYLALEKLSPKKKNFLYSVVVPRILRIVEEKNEDIAFRFLKFFPQESAKDILSLVSSNEIKEVRYKIIKEAGEKRDLKFFKILIEETNLHPDNVREMFIFSIKENETDLIQKLIEHKNLPLKDLEFAYKVAAKTNNVDVLRKLTEIAYDQYGVESAFIIASNNKKAEVVKFIIRNYLINEDYVISSLKGFSGEGDFSTVKTLFKYSKPSKGSMVYAFFHALENGKLNLVEKLLEIEEIGLNLGEEGFIQILRSVLDNRNLSAMRILLNSTDDPNRFLGKVLKHSNYRSPYGGVHPAQKWLEEHFLGKVYVSNPCHLLLKKTL